LENARQYDKIDYDLREKLGRDDVIKINIDTIEHISLITQQEQSHDKF